MLGESGHLLDTVSLSTQISIDKTAELYGLLKREPLAARRAHLETLLLADQFRFPADDWRARAVRHILHQIRVLENRSCLSV